MSNDVRVSLSKIVRQVEIISTDVISDEDKLRLVISNCGPTNAIIVKGKIINQDDYDTITTITGNSKSVISIKTYDYVQLECTVFDSLTDHIKVVAASFNDAGGSTSIDAPSGGIIQDAELITFESSDSTISITTNPLTNTIDIKSLVSGGSSSRYVKQFNNTTDWTGPSAGLYTLSLPFSFHSVVNPSINVYEYNGSSYDIVLISSNVDTSNNITINVSEIPDNRFTGKLVIE